MRKRVASNTDAPELTDFGLHTNAYLVRVAHPVIDKKLTQPNG